MEGPSNRHAGPGGIAVSLVCQQQGFRLEAEFTAGSGITAISGPSGAGKSTLANAIAGVIPATRGSIVCNNRVLYDSEQGINVPVARRRIGYVFQDSLLFPHKNVLQNLNYGAPGTPKLNRDMILSLLGIEALLDRRPQNLSGGERRRVALARAIFAEPDVIIMDEPLANLDTARRNEILPLVEMLRDRVGLPVLYITHSWPEIIRLADDIVILEEGSIKSAGPLADVLVREGLPDDLTPGGALIEAVVGEHEPADNLMQLETSAGELFVAATADRPNTRLRVFIAASDVALSTHRPAGTSIQNILSCSIGDIRPEGPGRCEIVLYLPDGQKLLSRITHRALTHLGLEKGQQVYALIKSVALDQSLMHHPLLS